MENANKKVANKYICKKCDYTTSKKSSWNKHIQTKKHLGQLLDKKCYEKVAQEKQDLSVCEDCGKSYKHYTSLIRHRKNCKKTKNNEKNQINQEQI